MSRRPRELSTTRAPTSRQTTHPAPTVDFRRAMDRVMWHARDLDPALLERLWTNSDGVIADGHMLKDGDRCTVVRIDQTPAGQGEPSSLTFKRYNLKSGMHTAVHAVLRSRAQWGWLSGRHLLAADLPTPTPLACIEERRQGLLRMRSYLLTTFVPGRSLLDLVHSGAASGEQLADLAKQFSRIWQTLGQLRAGHGDMKATNFIVDGDSRLWLIDLDGLRIYRSAAMLRRERRNDLTRFMRNWENQPAVAATFRARIGTG